MEPPSPPSADPRAGADAPAAAEASPAPTGPAPAGTATPARPTLDELTATALGRDGVRSMPLGQLYFRVTGRIPRRTFWVHGVLALLLAAMLGNVLLDIAGLSSDLNGKLLNTLLAWPYIAVSAKRLHDFNRSAWWMLVNLVPGIGSLVMLVVNGFVRGTEGPNEFGPDPMAVGGRPPRP